MSWTVMLVREVEDWFLDLDPKTADQAVLLVAGNKEGRWKDWYRTAIPLAEDRWQAWLSGYTIEE